MNPLVQMYDPVSYLLDHILQVHPDKSSVSGECVETQTSLPQNSTAKMAIASDTDLVAVFQVTCYDDVLHNAARPDAVSNRPETSSTIFKPR